MKISSSKIFWTCLRRAQFSVNLLENLQSCESWEIFHSNSIGSPSIPNNTDVRWILGSLEVDISILHLLLDAHTSFPDIELNPSRRVLLLSPT